MIGRITFHFFAVALCWSSASKAELRPARLFVGVMAPAIRVRLVLEPRNEPGEVGGYYFYESQGRPLFFQGKQEGETLTLRVPIDGMQPDGMSTAETISAKLAGPALVGEWRGENGAARRLTLSESAPESKDSGRLVEYSVCANAVFAATATADAAADKQVKRRLRPLAESFCAKGGVGDLHYAGDRSPLLVQGILSESLLEYAASDGPYPRTGCRGVTIDTKTGRALGLSDLIDAAAEKWLRAELFRDLYSQYQLPDGTLDEPLEFYLDLGGFWFVNPHLPHAVSARRQFIAFVSLAKHGKLSTRLAALQ